MHLSNSTVSNSPTDTTSCQKTDDASPTQHEQQKNNNTMLNDQERRQAEYLLKRLDAKLEIEDLDDLGFEIKDFLTDLIYND